LSELEDPLEKLLIPENLKKLGKILDSLSGVEKLMSRLSEMEKMGDLDTLMNLMSQLAALVDAAQKADLLGSLITFGVEQLSKVQAVWPLIQKLTDERTLTALQGVDVEGLIKGLNSLSPVLQKLSTEGAIRAMSSLDVEGLLSLLSKVAEMQRTGSLNAIFSLLSDQKMMDRFAVVIQRLSKALDIWANNLPNVKEVGLLGIPWALRDKDVQYGLGLVISLAGALGKSFRS